MDLLAYAQINDLQKIAKENGIEIPRLRGYRLMKDEKPVSQEELHAMLKDAVIEAVKDLCRSEPFWDPASHTSVFSTRTDNLQDFYLVKKKDEDERDRYVDVRWDRIHGRKRRILKFEIKKKRRAIQKQYNAWNRYAGRENILYIHSRMGGWNWQNYQEKSEILSQPWFLDRVDDWWDNTYCDFYAKVK